MDRRILIAYPSTGEVKAMFAYDLARLTGFIGASMMPHVVSKFNLYHVAGTLIAPQRMDIAATALANGYTHILWLDSDMRFPANTLLRLLSHNQPIVGANYSGRRMPCGTVALRYVKDSPKTEIVYTYPHSKGLEEVDVVGMGCLLTATEVFEKVQRPWFPILWANVGGEWLIHGEDAGFMEWAQDAGYHIYIDHDLSHEVQHIGDWEFGHEHALQMREDMKADPRFVVNDPETPKLVLERA